MPTIQHMASTNRNPEKWTRDRRASRRYPIDAEVQYQVIRQRKVIHVGRGRTLNLSSTGVLFVASYPVAPNQKIELSIVWPARLDDVVSLKLWVSGRTVRSRDDHVAVRILSYEFRSAGASEAS